MAFKKDMDRRIDEQNKRKRKPVFDDGPEDMELTIERERGLSIDTQKSVYAAGLGGEGINTEPSVFDKTAVFKIK